MAVLKYEEIMKMEEHEYKKKYRHKVYLVIGSIILAIIIGISSVLLYNRLSKHNLNKLTTENIYLLTDIDGIGDKRANEIIQHEPYKRWDDLKKLKYIDEKTIEKLKEKFYLK